MNKRPLIATALVAAVAIGAYTFLRNDHDHAHNPGSHEHGAEAAEKAFARGPHNGRLLSDGDFAVEITIFETGVPPEFRVYTTDDGDPVDPASVALAVELTRLGEAPQRILFKPQGDYLRGTAVVEEPHSFDVRVTAARDGHSHTWTYASYEGRTSITEPAATEAKVISEPAGPATLHTRVPVTGRVTADPEKFAHASPRFAGVIKSMSRNVGDRVAKGDTLATIESNDSLRTYQVAAPVAGTITRRDGVIGGTTGSGPLFEIADTSTVAVDFAVFPAQAATVKAGQTVTIEGPNGTSIAASIAGVSTAADVATQAIHVRAIFSNEAGWLVPGTVVTGKITVAEREVPLAVKVSALQTFRDWNVVFGQFGNTYEIRPLELGENDGTYAEVLGGLKPGTPYVTENSYLVKADIEKSGASHDH